MIALLGLFSTWMTDFPSCTSTSKIATLSYTWSLKLVPLSGCIGYYREYPPPPPLVKCMTHWWDCLACSSTHSSSFKSVFHLRPSRGCKLVWFETEIGGWTNSIHIKTSELILTPRKVSSAHLSSLEPLSLGLKAWRQCCGESVFLSWQGNSLEKKKCLKFLPQQIQISNRCQRNDKPGNICLKS